MRLGKIFSIVVVCCLCISSAANAGDCDEAKQLYTSATKLLSYEARAKAFQEARVADDERLDRDRGRARPTPPGGSPGARGRAPGGRQLDGSRAAFDQLAEIVDAVGDRIDVIMDGGIQRGTHVLKALSLGAKAVGVGRLYLYPLAAAGQAGTAPPADAVSGRPESGSSTGMSSTIA